VTVHVGDHVQPFDLPTVDWTVDAVVDMHLDHDLIRARDSAGGIHLLSADEVVLVGRHRRPEDIQPQPVTGGATIRGVVPDAHMGLGWFGGTQ
jgi:hypothetical protein